MRGQHPFLFQHFNIVVVEQFVCVNDVLMMANSNVRWNMISYAYHLCCEFDD